MLAEHLALLPWSGFVSLTSGTVNTRTGSWYFVPKSVRWWLNSCFGVLRNLSRQHLITLQAMRWVVRLELSPMRDLLHAHMLVWTGRPWNRSDAFRCNSLWNHKGNGTKHTRPYDSRLSGASYVLKGLHVPDSLHEAFRFESGQFERVSIGLGVVTSDVQTQRLVHAAYHSGHRQSSRLRVSSPPSETYRLTRPHHLQGRDSMHEGAGVCQGSAERPPAKPVTVLGRIPRVSPIAVSRDMVAPGHGLAQPFKALECITLG